MKKLTSRMTFFYKRVFPIIWFGFLGVFILISIFTFSIENGPGLLVIIMPIFMAVFGYFIMKKLVFDLIDEVWDEGSSLLLKSGGQEVRINLTDIKNISYSTMMNPPKVTLNLRFKTVLGDELSFTPPISFVPFKKNRDIEELINRIDQARG